MERATRPALPRLPRALAALAVARRRPPVAGGAIPAARGGGFRQDTPLEESATGALVASPASASDVPTAPAAAPAPVSTKRITFADQPTGRTK